MAEGSADQFINVPAWLVRLCKWCWHGRIFLFGTVLFSILLNLAAALPLVDPSTLHSLPIAWFFFHRLLLFGLFGLLLVVTILCGLIERLNAPLSNRQLRNRYLERVTRETELATLKGIPAGLISESVRLADIYIPPRFYANRARVDFPISDEELERYRQSLRQGVFAPDLERVLLEAEKNWQHVLKQGDQTGLDMIWQQLNKSNAVVIQGYPGMGKSTLMERLTLHMAAKGLHHSDLAMPQHEKLTPTLIPVLLRLGSYARALVDNADLSLSTYLYRTLEDMDLPGLSTCIQQYLKNGTCLVMLDGLDEVSEPERREQVQKEIRRLIDGTYHSCRFLITSRVAGYDQAAFPAYPHFTLADLTDQEISCYLPRWCRANLDRERTLRSTKISEASIASEVERQVPALKAAIQDNQGVRELAKNPLLLTLLLVMQQNSIVLPRQRVELYDTVTKTLLENHNIAKGLEEVPEFQAIKRLGPLAFQMQEADSDLVRLGEVEQALIEVIRCEGVTEEHVSMEARLFLQRVRERGGLFVSRVGDYFGFMHRTFQEYFAARYILNQIKTDQQRWIGELIQRARRQDALWREPFLLAVAYQSKENELIASEILRTLLADKSGNTFEQEISIVLLAADAIIEAKPLTLDVQLQQETAERLLACYEKALYTRKAPTCQDIENLTHRWLCSLPKEAYRLPLLDVILQAMKETQQETHQRAVLTLLTLIAHRLEPCSELVFETIIPPLLALIGLPAVGRYVATTNLAISLDFYIVDLARCVLSFLNRHSPGSLYLETTREFFNKKPAQLRQLARCSLERGILITPTIVPLVKENYRPYATAIQRWIDLQKQVTRQITEQNVTECCNIQQTLLDCAEAVSYPIAHHLLVMLESSEAHTGRPWSEVWQAYLLEQLNTGSYVDYQSAVFLWNALFPGNQLPSLVNSVMKHYTASDYIRKRYAQRLFSCLSKYFIYLMKFRPMRDFSHSRDFRDFRDSIDLMFLMIFISSSDLRGLMGFSDLRNFSDLVKFRDFRDSSDFIGLAKFRDLMITSHSVEIAQSYLSTSNKAEKIDLLTIIQGRLLQFQKNDEIDNKIETEIQFLARAALQELTLPEIDEEVQQAALDVLQTLPAHTVAEIALIWEILDKTQSKQIQYACTYALQRAQPVTDTAWKELEKGKSSVVKEVRDVVEEAIKKKK